MNNHLLKYFSLALFEKIKINKHLPVLEFLLLIECVSN